jgi:hypothetical protein
MYTASLWFGCPEQLGHLLFLFIINTPNRFPFQSPTRGAFRGPESPQSGIVVFILFIHAHTSTGSVRGEADVTRVVGKPIQEPVTSRVSFIVRLGRFIVIRGIEHHCSPPDSEGHARIELAVACIILTSSFIRVRACKTIRESFADRPPQ